jgi:hypothetical protein
MNRKQRQDGKKLSRNATDDEIFPGRHGPVQATVVDQMTAVMSVLHKAFPDFHLTLFLAEKEGRDGAPSRFNYMSTAERADMLAVLRAFVAKNQAQGATLDRIEDQPPSRRPS